MDRDNRWERTQKAFEAIVESPNTVHGTEPLADVQRRYDAGVTDEFIEPVVLRGPPRLDPGRHRDLLQLPPRPRRGSSPQLLGELAST